MCGEDDDDTCCCLSRENSDRAFVVVVVTIISYGFFSYITLIVIPWRWWSTPIGLVNVIGLFISFYLLCYSYYKSITTSPGFVKKGWIDAEASEQDRAWARSEESKNPRKYMDPATFYKPRWCPYCQSYKPPRSHHCKELGRCVLKMDHYCPWVYNAVGYRNHKYFVLFLIYATGSLSYHLICVILRIAYTLSSGKPPFFSVFEIVMFSLQLIFVLPVTIAIGSLLGYQISCIWNGMTSIESFLEKSYRKAAQRAGRKFRWYYDFGTVDNMKQVLGPRVRDWLKTSAQSHFTKDGGWEFKTRHYDSIPIPAEAPPTGAEQLGNMVTQAAKQQQPEKNKQQEQTNNKNNSTPNKGAQKSGVQPVNKGKKQQKR